MLEMLAKISFCKFFYFCFVYLLLSFTKAFFSKVLTKIKKLEDISLVHIDVEHASLYLLLIIEGPSMYLCVAKNYLLKRILSQFWITFSIDLYSLKQSKNISIKFVQGDSCAILTFFKSVVILADFVLISAKMTTLLKEMRIAQLSS